MYGAFSPISSTNNISTQNPSMPIDAAESVEQQAASSTQAPLFDVSIQDMARALCRTNHGLHRFMVKNICLMDGGMNPKGWFSVQSMFTNLRIMAPICHGKVYSSRLTRRNADDRSSSSSSPSHSSSSSSVDLLVTFSDYEGLSLASTIKYLTNHGQKYLLDGWWNPKLDGFKREFYSQLVSHGAIYDTTTVVIVGDQHKSITNLPPTKRVMTISA